jgi:hypothetical protein
MPSRDDMLAELGLTPVWRLRVRTRWGARNRRENGGAR